MDKVTVSMSISDCVISASFSFRSPRKVRNSRRTFEIMWRTLKRTEEWAGSIDQVEIAVSGLTAVNIKLLLLGHWLASTVRMGGSRGRLGGKDTRRYSERTYPPGLGT